MRASRLRSRENSAAGIQARRDIVGGGDARGGSRLPSFVEHPAQRGRACGSPPARSPRWWRGTTAARWRSLPFAADAIAVTDSRAAQGEQAREADTTAAHATAGYDQQFESALVDAVTAVIATTSRGWPILAGHTTYLRSASRRFVPGGWLSLAVGGVRHG